MKKTLCFIVAFMSVIVTFAQTVTLTFIAKDGNNRNVQLNSVSITNLTKGWQETIYWPDTTLIMQNGTGIDDYTQNNGFVLSQNNPNPFMGTTEVSLTVAKEGDVGLQISDVNGKIVETQKFSSLHLGIHQFRITLPMAGTYIMTAHQNGQISSIKMICNGGGDGNKIEYAGSVLANNYSSKPTKSNPRGVTTNPFTSGDQMKYVGYAIINDSLVESHNIVQPQSASQTITLRFSEIQGQLPTVTTVVSNITSGTAQVGGTVTYDGPGTVISRGVCYSTTEMPTVSDDCFYLGYGTGSFSGTLMGLTANTTYYVRAFAMSNYGTAYGDQMSFTTAISGGSSIIVVTESATNILLYSATCGGNVTYDWGENIMARGICWNTSHNPTLDGSHTTEGSGVGSFSSQMTGLTPNTTYYVRAYTVSNLGTSYGNEVEFTTIIDSVPCFGTPTLTDYDGNIYNTVRIGHQCWMRENLRTTHYADGTSIPLSSSTSSTVGYRHYPNSDSSVVYTHGYLYNWTAVMHGDSPSNSNPSGVQGICPTGWHLPSKAEWSQLINYVISQSQYWCDINNTSSYAKALASTYGWYSSTELCAVGNNQGANNATGFSVLPAGEYHVVNYYEEYLYFGYHTKFFSCTLGEQDSSGYRPIIGIYFSRLSSRVWNMDLSYYRGYSVRCVRD
jgi:uncharacterized protein (TIGR02145 family)